MILVLPVILSGNLSVRVRAKDSSESFEEWDDAGWLRVGVTDVGPNLHDFTVTSTERQINLTAKFYSKCFSKLVEIVQHLNGDKGNSEPFN